MSEQDRLEINWFNVTGSALGAVSAAVLLSTLGTAGTLIGAAMGSLCITAGGAVYAHSLRKGKERLAAAQALAARRRTLPSRTTSSPVGVDEEHAVPAGVTPPIAGATAVDLDPPDQRNAWSQTLRVLPWKRIVATGVLIFVAAMALILAFEVVAGRSLSSFTGGSNDRGTSIPGFDGRGGGDSEDDGQDGTPSDQQEQPEEQEEDPADPAPTEGPSPEPVETPAAPVPEPTAPPVEVQPTPTP